MTSAPLVTASMCAAGRTLADPHLSPDGASIAYVASSAAGAQLLLTPAAGGPESVLAGVVPGRRGGIAWMPDGRALVVCGSDGRLWLQPVGGGPATSLCEPRGAAAPVVSPDGTSVACTFEGRHVALVATDPSGPWPRRLSSGADFCVDPSWSPDGSTVAWHEWDVPAMAWDDSRVAWSRVDGAGAGTVASEGDGGEVAVSQPRFAPDGRLGLLCDATGWLTLWCAPRVGRPATPLVDDDAEHGGPTWGPGQRSWAWSPDGRAVAYTRNLEGFGELCVMDLATREIGVVDRGVFDGLSWGGGRLAALRSGARTPDQVVVYEDPMRALGDGGPTGRRTVARGPVAGVEAGAVEPEVVGWDSVEVGGVGARVHGRLWRSPGGTGPGPLLVWVHGGPTDQHRVSFRARAAFFLQRGWSLLQVDPRGSTGWGRAYAQALTGRWGRLDVDDTIAGIEAASAEGWADPARVALMGGSSAGLVVLSVLATRPGLCAAGVDLYGVTDLWALHSTTHRFEAHYTPRLVGPLPAAARDWTDRSPITHAGRIRDPLLVLYGSADQVVLPEQSERLVSALEAGGAPVEHHCYEGEGHGWSRPATVVDELSRIDDFLTRHVLRGRRS